MCFGRGTHSFLLEMYLGWKLWVISVLHSRVPNCSPRWKTQCVCSPDLTLGWFWVLYVLDRFFFFFLVVCLFFILLYGTVLWNWQQCLYCGYVRTEAMGLIHPSRVPGWRAAKTRALSISDICPELLGSLLSGRKKNPSFSSKSPSLAYVYLTSPSSCFCAYPRPVTWKYPRGYIFSFYSHKNNLPKWA